MTRATRLAERATATTVAYWAFTTAMVAESAAGGTMDLLRMAPFYPLMIQLGYPSYLATILGIAKLLAAVILLAPGLPRLKEWAYAGIMINMIGAAASNAATHQSTGSTLTPLVFAVIAMLSWALRPASRRLFNTSGRSTADDKELVDVAVLGVGPRTESGAERRSRS
jgi:hypothetical protein